MLLLILINENCIVIVSQQTVAIAALSIITGKSLAKSLCIKVAWNDI